MTLIDKAKMLMSFRCNAMKYAAINLHVTSKSNEWNMLAIELVGEGMKPPTQRKQLNHFASFSQQEITTAKLNLTTDDWNRLALTLVDAGHQKTSRVKLKVPGSN